MLESDEDAQEFLKELFEKIVNPMVTFLVKGKTPEG